MFYAAHIGRFEMPIIFVFSVAVYLAAAWRPGISAPVLSGRCDRQPRRLFSCRWHLGTSGRGSGRRLGATAPACAVVARGPVGNGRCAGVAILYLSLIDLDALRWALTGDYRNAVGPQAASTGGFSAYLSNWLQLTLRGSWVAGPIYEGTLLTAIGLPWFIVGLSMRRTRFGVTTLLIGAALCRHRGRVCHSGCGGLPHPAAPGLPTLGRRSDHLHPSARKTRRACAERLPAADTRHCTTGSSRRRTCRLAPCILAAK